MNYISLLFFFLVLCLLPVGIGAQDTVFVTDATLTNGNYHWTADKLYVLRDMVGLDSGGVLTIDAGTVIKADVEQFPYPESGLGLIVARGAKIYANGTAAAPIIFTATSDNLDDPTDLGPRDHGLWDGLMILGRARIATESGESYLNFREPFISRWPYGGDDDEDSSGSLRYVSVRHAGSLGHYLAGGSVAFLGVGRGTVVDHVESFASSQSGFRIFGGTVDLRHLVSAHTFRNGFEINVGYRGRGQFWLGVGMERQLIEVLGNAYDIPPATEPNLANLTLVRVEGEFPFNNTSNQGLNFRINAGGHFRNSLILHAGVDDILVGATQPEGDSWGRFLTGNLSFIGNRFLAKPNLPDWRSYVTVHDNWHAPVDTAQLVNYVAANNQLNSVNPLRNADYTDNFAFNPLLKTGSSANTDGTPILEPFFEPVNYQGAFGNKDAWHHWTFTGTDLGDFQIITGTVRQGALDCSVPAAANPAANVLVALETEGTTRYATTDSSGYFRAFVPPGTTTVRALSPSRAWTECAVQTVTLAEKQDAHLELALGASEECALPRVSIRTAFISQAFPNVYHVAYDNLGGAPALNAEIAVMLDPNLTVLSTTPGSTRRVGDTLFFALGDLPALAPVGTIVLETELDPNVPPGTELCATALITAANACPPDSGPALRVTAQCTENDSVRFVVNNLGDPATNIPYVVIEDEVMFQQGAFDVDAGEQETFLFPAGTGTYHFSTLANPDAVMPTKTAATLSCADAPELGQRYFPATDLQQHVSVDCQPNFGVDFDSIGLDCTPLGLTNERIVLPESTLDYRVYFQHDNAGGNTTVTIVDTLPAAVDPATLTLGAASHPYAWSLEGERTLKVTFSNLTEPELSGFVNFRVQLSPTASPGTEVNNYAEVYYAADPPVVTNRTQRKVGTLVDKTTALSSVSVQPDLLRVYPQPASDFLYLERQDGVPLRGELSVFTADGSRISRGPARGQRQRVFVQNLPPGMYFIVLRDRADAQVYTRRFVVD